MIQLQIHFTDSASQLTYLQKYHKGVFILSLKSYFLKYRPLSTEPPFACDGQIYLIIIRIACVIIVYVLWNYYSSKVYSLASFSNLNVRVFSGQKENGSFCLPEHQ